MSDILPAHFCSAYISKTETDAVCLALASQGKEPLFCDAAPGLRGFGEGKSYLHQEAEVLLYGKTLPAWFQHSGTCIGQGNGRGLEDANNSALAFGGALGKPTRIAYEPMYALSRTQIGRGSLGTGDGSCGAWMAQTVHDLGILPRGVYGTIDLSEPQERLAVQWGMPRATTPQQLKDVMRNYPSAACMKATSVEDVRDALIARYGVARCDAKATHGTRDANGMLRPVASGGHCQELCGCFVDIHGDLIFQEQQSWGPTSGPVGGGTFKLQDGREIQPREGSCGIRPEDVAGYIRNGEIWILAIPKNTFGWEAA